MRVAILGAGPAALMAGYAVERNGHEPEFYARPLKSHVLEGSYLMRALPALSISDTTACDGWINYIAVGSREGYAAKVYGDRDAPVSWDSVAWGTKPLWWLSSYYDALWDRYYGGIHSSELSSDTAAELASHFDFAINTVPLNAICTKPEEHKFLGADISLARVPADQERLRGGNMMIYNGDIDVDWFKFTRCHGWDTWEYGQRIPEIMEHAEAAYQVSRGVKLVSNTCDCHPRLHRVGRWGQWKRGVLNHHAFEHTQALLASAGLGKGA